MFSLKTAGFRALLDLAIRTSPWHDDKTPRAWPFINRELARMVFDSPTNAIGKYFKNREGTRIQVIGIVEDGKYNSITEDPQTAMFVPILQVSSSQTSLVVRSSDPPQLAAIRDALRNLDTVCLFTSSRGANNWTPLCLLRVWR